MMAVRPKPVISHNHRGTFIGYLSPAARRPRRCTLDYPGCTDDRSTGPLSGSVADRRLAALLGLEQGRRVRGVAQVHALGHLVTARGPPPPPASPPPCAPRPPGGGGSRSCSHRKPIANPRLTIPWNARNPSVS